MASVQLFNEHLELLATIARNRNDLQFYCIVHYFDLMHSVYMEIVTSQSLMPCYTLCMHVFHDNIQH